MKKMILFKRMSKNDWIRIKKQFKNGLKYWYLVIIQLLALFVAINEFLTLDLYNNMGHGDNDVRAYIFVIVLIYVFNRYIGKIVSKKVRGETVESNYSKPI